MEQNVGLKTPTEFRQHCTRRYGNFHRAWRKAIDTYGNGKLGFDPFCNVARRMGYIGDIRQLFADLDANESGNVSLADLDFGTSQLFYDMSLLLAQKGGLKKAVKEALGTTDNLKHFPYDDFVRLAEVLGVEKGKRRSLFDAIDIDALGYVTLESMGFLEGWDHDQ